MFLHRACNIIIKHKPTKCTLSKLIFYFFNFEVFYMFRTRRLIFSKTVVMQVWYGMVCFTYIGIKIESTRLHVKRTIPQMHIQPSLPEDEPSGSKHVEDINIKN